MKIYQKYMKNVFSFHQKIQFKVQSLLSAAQFLMAQKFLQRPDFEITIKELNNLVIKQSMEFFNAASRSV